MNKNDIPYTKKQLQEAISYWTRKLKAMNESKAQVIDDLIDAFGENVVLSKKRTFQPTTDELRKIYNILNKNLFAGELDTIPATMETEQTIVDKLNIYNVVSKSYENPVERLPPGVDGVFLSAPHIILNDDGKAEDVSFFYDIIMLNRDLLGLSVFIFVVACLCHEMIHYCDRFSDEFKQKYITKSNNMGESSIKLDSHDDKIFKEKLKLANDNGINVKKTASSSVGTDNAESCVVLKKVLDENEGSGDIAIWQTKDMLSIMNKRTCRGLLAIFN